MPPTWDDETELPDGFYSISDIQEIISNTLLKSMKH